jgi:serine/threonine-protein kinase RsbW
LYSKSAVRADQTESSWQVAHMAAASVPEGITDLRQRIMAFLSTPPFTPEDLSAVELAVGEACTNAFKHGSPKRELDEVRVKCMRNHRTLVVEITDCGCGFNPEQVTPPKPEELRECGMGIMLMRGSMDAVEFEFGRGTTVRLVKHCRSSVTEL